MQHYCAISNEMTNDMTWSEIEEILRKLFTQEQMAEAKQFLTGEHPVQNAHNVRRFSNTHQRG